LGVDDRALRSVAANRQRVGDVQLPLRQSNGTAVDGRVEQDRIGPGGLVGLGDRIAKGHAAVRTAWVSAVGDRERGQQNPIFEDLSALERQMRLTQQTSPDAISPTES